MPRGRSNEFLRPVSQQISDEYFRTGTVSQEAMNDLFKQAYDLGIVQDREFYDQYKHIKVHLRSTGVTLSQQDQVDIADFKDFRTRARYVLKIKDEGGVPVDVVRKVKDDLLNEVFRTVRLVLLIELSTGFADRFQHSMLIHIFCGHIDHANCYIRAMIGYSLQAG